MGNTVLFEREENIVTLTLNEPQRRNPLTGNTMVPELLEAIDRIHRDTEIHAVVLTGAGSAFSTGGDIRDMQRQLAPDKPLMEIRQEYRLGIQQVPLALFNLEVPVIAAVNGPAMGAGLDLACMCDIRIASEKAVFGETFVKLGIIPGDGGAWLLQRLIGLSRAAEMTLTGGAIDAATALEWGLVSKVVTTEDLAQEAQRLAQKIAKNSGPATRMAKRLMREAMHTPLSTLLELSAAYQAIAHKTQEHREAVESFVAKQSRVQP